jgi:hypothetical protein
VVFHSDAKSVAKKEVRKKKKAKKRRDWTFNSRCFGERNAGSENFDDLVEVDQMSQAKRIWNWSGEKEKEKLYFFGRWLRLAAELP